MWHSVRNRYSHLTLDLRLTTAWLVPSRNCSAPSHIVYMQIHDHYRVLHACFNSRSVQMLDSTWFSDCSTPVIPGQMRLRKQLRMPMHLPAYVTCTSEVLMDFCGTLSPFMAVAFKTPQGQKKRTAADAEAAAVAAAAVSWEEAATTYLTSRLSTAFFAPC